MIFVSTKDNKKVLRKYTELWDETKIQIATINGSKPIKNKKDFMKTKFYSDDDLPIDKILSILILHKSVFKNYNQYYPQVYIHEWGYEL